MNTEAPKEISPFKIITRILYAILIPYFVLFYAFDLHSVIEKPGFGAYNNIVRNEQMNEPLRRARLNLYALRGIDERSQWYDMPMYEAAVRFEDLYYVRKALPRLSEQELQNAEFVATQLDLEDVLAVISEFKYSSVD